MRTRSVVGAPARVLRMKDALVAAGNTNNGVDERRIRRGGKSPLSPVLEYLSQEGLSIKRCHNVDLRKILIQQIGTIETYNPFDEIEDHAILHLHIKSLHLEQHITIHSIRPTGHFHTLRP